MTVKEIVKKYLDDNKGDLCFYSDLLPILKELDDFKTGYEQLAQVSADVSDELDKCKADLKEMIETKQFIAQKYDEQHFELLDLQEENAQLRKDREELIEALGIFVKTGFISYIKSADMKKARELLSRLTKTTQGGG